MQQKSETEPLDFAGVPQQKVEYSNIDYISSPRVHQKLIRIGPLVHDVTFGLKRRNL